jgi:hypothetical protein
VVVSLFVEETTDLPQVTDRVRGMMFNATFNNISVIWWRSVLLVEETGTPGENHLTNFIT